MDLRNFAVLARKMRGALPLQIMVGMTKHPAFATDLVQHALQKEDGESYAGRLARATRQAMERHAQRVRSQAALTLLCHSTLDYQVSHAVGIATWRQRLKLLSKLAPSADGATGTAQDRVVIDAAGQEYRWTGDTSRLQALVPSSGGGWPSFFCSGLLANGLSTACAHAHLVS